jgi:hypothetical protein
MDIQVFLKQDHLHREIPAKFVSELPSRLQIIPGMTYMEYQVLATLNLLRDRMQNPSFTLTEMVCMYVCLYVFIYMKFDRSVSVYMHVFGHIEFTLTIVKCRKKPLL